MYVRVKTKADVYLTNPGDKAFIHAAVHQDSLEIAAKKKLMSVNHTPVYEVRLIPMDHFFFVFVFQDIQWYHILDHEVILCFFSAREKKKAEPNVLSIVGLNLAPFL